MTLSELNKIPRNRRGAILSSNNNLWRYGQRLLCPKLRAISIWDDTRPVGRRDYVCYDVALESEPCRQGDCAKTACHKFRQRYLDPKRLIVIQSSSGR